VPWCFQPYAATHINTGIKIVRGGVYLRNTGLDILDEILKHFYISRYFGPQRADVPSEYGRNSCDRLSPSKERIFNLEELL